ncbi:MAG: hypothetical protein AAF358_11595 [Pseudomonadota bacterium]
MATEGLEKTTLSDHVALPVMPTFDANRKLSADWAERQPVQERQDAEAIAGYNVILDETIGINTWVTAQVEAIKRAKPSEFPRQRRHAEAGDPEAAMWLYFFFDYCRKAPRTDWGVQNRLAQIEAFVQRREEQAKVIDVDQYEASLESLMHSYRLCSQLGADVKADLAALEWITKAADLGHMGAQRLYHFRARDLIAGYDADLVFRHPQLIAVFQQNAANYAKQLLNSHHPQGLLLMSRMLHTGDVYRKDALKAYAYAKAAEIAGVDGIPEDARGRMRWIAWDLSAEEVEEATSLAYRILD